MLCVQKISKIKIAKFLTVSMLLTGISILMSSTFPTIQFSPLVTYTFAVHVPIFIACLLSPHMAISVSLGSTLGFLISKPPLVTARIATHLIFAILASLYFKKFGIPKKKLHLATAAIVVSIIHALSEAIVMHIFFFPQESNPFYSIYFILGGWMFLYSCIDFVIAYSIYKRMGN